MTEREEPGALILVVDDDEAVRMLARLALEQAGFKVEEADNGRMALARFEALHPDLVLLDVMMPELDGFGVCACIRELPGGAHIPIVMMTGLDDIDSINRSYEAGATDFATKPINFTLIPHRVLYMLRAKRTADELRASEARLETAQRIAKLGHFEWEVESDRMECSPQLREIFGLSAADAITSRKEFLQHVLPEDRSHVSRIFEEAVRGRRHYNVEYRILGIDGAVRTVYEEGEFLAPGDRIGQALTGTIQDITERRRMEKHVRHLVFFDGVTGLPNRTLMRRQLAQALGVAQRHNRILAVLALDVDHFGRVNDTLGHHSGDDLLRLIGHRLQTCVRLSDGVGSRCVSGDGGPDAVARVGGDEFIILLTEIEKAEDAALIARRIRDCLLPPCRVGNAEITVTVSIGISVFPIDSRDGDTLLKQADAAVRHAKRRGRDCYQFSTTKINAQASERFALENRLRKALTFGEFELHYQPKISLKDEAVSGMEALVRWRHPDLGMIAPAHFIPVAEETGLIVPLGEWVLEEGCRQAKQWQEAGMPPLVISVNLSAVQMRRGNLPKLVANVIAETGLNPCFIELELTESLLMEDLEGSIGLMRELQAIGVGMSIDDFGTGYSSLSYLKRFPVHTLKIDQSFVRDIPADNDDAAIVTAILALGHSLRLEVVAEGVETETQLRFLNERGCDQIQGYYFSAPLPAAEFSEWIRDGGPRRVSGRN